MKFRSLSIAIAASMIVSAPAATAQTMSAAEVREQTRQMCAEAAARTDQPARDWHAAHCNGPTRVGQGAGRGALPVGVLFGLAITALAIWQ